MKLMKKDLNKTFMPFMLFMVKISFLDRNHTSE
jgi:hypothetical protein